MLTLFTFPETFYATLSGYITDVFDSASPLIFIVIGLVIGFFVIERLIDIVRT